MEVVDGQWLNDHLTDPKLTILDPRPPVKYLAGHIPGAVNLPVSRVFDGKTLELLSEEKLAQTLGEGGVGTDSAVALYDGYDGQNAAMLAWVLEYLGHPEVKILSRFVESWEEEGGEVRYRPVMSSPRVFHAKPNLNVRAFWGELKTGDRKLLDLRSQDEFHGNTTTETRQGHLPGAVNLPWTSLLGSNGQFLQPGQKLEEILTRAGLGRQDQIVTYCSFGPRATIGYLALQQQGYRSVRVYDGSFHQWSQMLDLPVEGGRDETGKKPGTTNLQNPCITPELPF